MEVVKGGERLPGQLGEEGLGQAAGVRLFG